MKNKFITIVAVLLAFIAGAELTYILLNNSNKEDNNKGEKVNVTNNSCSNCMSGTIVIENGGITQTVDKIYDSIVMIKNYQNNRLSGSGSGFVYKTDETYGYIMTNQHVVSGADRLSAVFTNKEEVTAELLGGDKYIDIAVVRVPKDKIISVAKIGSTSDIKLGDTVVAIGTPISESYYNSITGGHISGLDRKVNVTVESKNDWIQDVIQVDAAINPGNSGGALVNFNGEVIGVTSLKLVSSDIEGMGFAIKIEDAMKHVDKLEKGETIDKPYLGVTHCNLTERGVISRYGLTIDSSIQEGIVILSTIDGSGAEQAGLKSGDVVTKIDDDKVINSAYLKYLLFKHSYGDTVTVTYIRGTETKTVKVTLINVEQ